MEAIKTNYNTGKIPYGASIEGTISFSGIWGITGYTYPKEQNYCSFILHKYGYDRTIHVRNMDGTWNYVEEALKDDFNYTDVKITTSANNSIIITGAPKGSEYIPVIIAHKETNNCQDTVVYDGGTWKICSTVSQNTTIRFYHMPIS